MNSKLIQIICGYFKLGICTAKPIKISRGFMHQVWKITTSEGIFAIKQFQCDVTEKNIIVTETIARAFKNNNIPAIAALISNADPLLSIDNNYYLVYPWYEGSFLSRKKSDIDFAIKVGEILGKMHNLNLCIEHAVKIDWSMESITDWKEWIQQAERMKKPWSKVIKQYQLILSAWIVQAEKFAEIRDRDLILSHNDLIPDNIIWSSSDDPMIIDWDHAGYINREIDLFNVAINWSGIYGGEVDAKCFSALLKFYENITQHKIIITPDIVYASLTSWLNWLTLNIKRSIGLIKATKKQQYLAEREIIITCKILEYLTGEFLQFITAL